MSTPTPTMADAAATATGPGGELELELVERFLSDDPAVWRPAHDELLARIWPRLGRRAAQQDTDNHPALLTLASPQTRDDAPQAVGITKTRHSGSCGICGAALAAPRRGPQPSYCSRACRTRAWRARSVEASSQATTPVVPEAGRWPA